MSIQPKTKRSELLVQINNLLLPGKFVDLESPDVSSIMDEIDRLYIADQDSALWARALMLHLAGDMAGALAVLDQCRTCEPMQRLVLLSNYSRCREAQVLYEAHCGPDSGHFTAGVVFGRVAGAFHKLAEFSRRAERMCLSNLDGIRLEEIYMVDQLLTEMGVTDEVSGDLMETAGAVLEEHGLMFRGSGPEIDVFDLPGELRTVHLTYRLSTTGAEAVAIYMDFINRLFNTQRTIPQGMHISFEGIDA